MTKSGKKITFNHQLKGGSGRYDCWEFRPSQMNGVSGNNMLCLKCYVTLPAKYHFFGAEFHEDVAALNRLVTDRIVYSFIFLPAEGSDAAQKILADLSENNPDKDFTQLHGSKTSL